MNKWVLLLKNVIPKERFVGNELSKDVFVTGRLLILFLAAIFIVFSIAEGQVTATGLFQSPQSPPSEPPPEPTATPVPPPPPTDTPIPADTPIPEPTATPIPVESSEEAASTEGETASTEAEAPVVVEEAVVEQQQAEPTPTETVLPAASESTESQQPDAVIEPAPEEASVAPEPAPLRRNPSDEVETEESGRNLVLDQAELIDTVAVSGAYIWLCCGIGLLLLAPLSLLLIYIRGRNRILQEEL